MSDLSPAFWKACGNCAISGGRRAGRATRSRSAGGWPWAGRTCASAWQPDVAVFAKAMGNGHPMAAIIGRGDVMQAAQDSFISSTYWTEGVGPAAALATIRKMQRVDVPGHVATIGEQLRAGHCSRSPRAGVPLTISGHPAMTYLRLRPSRGLGPANAFDRAHAAARISGRRRVLSQSGPYARARGSLLGRRRRSVRRVGQAVREGDVAGRIGGPVRHSAFARLA